MGPVFWSIAAGAGTTLGALVLLAWRHPSRRAFDLALSASAGIMLAATVLGLLPNAISSGPFVAVIGGFALGAGLIALCDRKIPHWHATFVERRGHVEDLSEEDKEQAAGVRRATLLVGAITLHNAPEGMAVGIAFAHGGELGVALALAILLHNIPEGLAVALPLSALGTPLRKTIWWTSLTGLVEILGALLGYALGQQLEPLLPWGLAFAAGAMLYVVIDEMIPAAHLRGEQRASVVFLAAFLLMATVMHLLGVNVT